MVHGAESRVSPFDADRSDVIVESPLKLLVATPIIDRMCANGVTFASF